MEHYFIEFITIVTFAVGFIYGYIIGTGRSNARHAQKAKPNAE